MKIRLTVPLCDSDCARRNALTDKPPGLRLQQGTMGTLIETFDKGESYMVEFNHKDTGECQWLGLLQRCEIEFVPEIARAA